MDPGKGSKDLLGPYTVLGRPCTVIVSSLAAGAAHYWLRDGRHTNSIVEMFELVLANDSIVRESLCF